jgi:CDP-diacylglycerol--glycerol-3-phosphate 3-phosphatidyltransferase
MQGTGTNPASSLLNLPNKLTTARLFLAFVLFALIYLDQWIAALVTFGAAAVTDWLDGYLARKQGLTSPFGRIYDPLVDKVLVSGTFVFLLEEKSSGLNAWMVTIVVSREFLVTGLRAYLEERGVSFGADWLGKLKMVAQCAAIIWILIYLFVLSQERIVPFFIVMRDALNYLMVLLTFLSGANYIVRGVPHLV